MSEVKHTPGPWQVKFDDFDEALHITSRERLDGDKVEISLVSVGYNDPFESEQQANAHLIAAAPEMLEALKMARGWLDAWGSSGPCLDVIDAAIAKATGAAK